MMSEAPQEGRQATRGWFRRNAKWLLPVLGTGLVYGLGAAGQRGAFRDGGLLARNLPTTLTTGVRTVSAQATRFTHLVDGGLQRLRVPGIQTPTDANSARQIRENIIRGSGPTRPSEIS